MDLSGTKVRLLTGRRGFLLTLSCFFFLYCCRERIYFPQISLLSEISIHFKTWGFLLAWKKKNKRSLRQHSNGWILTPPSICHWKQNTVGNWLMCVGTQCSGCQMHPCSVSQISDASKLNQHLSSLPLQNLN